MLLTVLGCSGSVPGPNAPTSGYLLEAEGFRLLIDLGNGALSALSALLDPADVHAVLVSHLHVDHCADLLPLTVLRRYRPDLSDQLRPLPLFAPEQAPSRLAAGIAASAEERDETDLSDVFDHHALSDKTVHIGPFEVRPVGVDHLCEAYGFRIGYRGKTLAYTGDTGPCAALPGLADGVDLLLAEATWTHHPDRPTGMHLSGTQAGQLAATADVRRLLLTHVAPWTDPRAVLDEARDVYDGQLELAEQRAVYRLG